MFDIDDSRKLPGLDLADLATSKVEVELDFEGMAPCFDFNDADPAAQAEMLVKARTQLGDLRMVSRVASEHYEQACRVTGRIRFDDRVIAFDGGGHRDHSWGPRDWSPPASGRGSPASSAMRLAFNLSRVAIASVDIFNGFMTREGRNYPRAQGEPWRRSSRKTA